MKKIALLIFSILAIKSQGFSQSNNDILNLLIKNNSISQNDADSLRANSAIDQQNFLPDKRFRVDFEFRPRAEVRNGYQQLPNDTTTAAFFVNQRSRLSLNYVNENKLSLCFSAQDLRVWGQQDPKSATLSTLQVFEAWVEPYFTKNFSIRIGRQRLSYDNQRLFAENDWGISARTHDAVTFRFNSPRITTELATAFNQSAENTFGTDYVPGGFTNYKFLAVNYFRYMLNDAIVLSAINASDGYQKKENAEKMNLRFTDGGRVEFTHQSLYLTLAGYYQSGKNSSGSKISAWYLQPEIRSLVPGNFTIRLGAEVFSGNEGASASTTDHTFVPLYGTNHRFNGSLDLITKFQSDVGNAGLINPYLFLVKGIGKKLEARTDFHTFHSKEVYIKSDASYPRFLGFENDWLLTYKPNSFTKLETGISYARMSESFEVIKKAATGAHTHTPVWFYLALTLRPTLFSTNFK